MIIKYFILISFLSIISKEICVVSLSYNNSKWYQQSLLSLLSQEDQDWKLIYVDDCSTDSTGNLVETFLSQKLAPQRYKVIKNKERLGAMHNFYNVIHDLPDDAIVVTLDGDDWFAHTKVISKIRYVYENFDVWITFGSYKDTLGRVIVDAPIPSDVIKKRSFRKYRWVFSHVRTFYAGLFKKIKKEDLMYNGQFLECVCDQASMLPMLEMAGEKFYQFREVMYIYNIQNPISDFRKHGSKMSKIANYIRNKPCYEKSLLLQDLCITDQ